jgi:polar amino acid transport system permease protein
VSHFAHYLTIGYLYAGLLVAVEITVAAFAGGFCLGLILAVMRESRVAVTRRFAIVYIWVWRGTPILLQLIFLYDVLPAAGIRFSSLVTAVLGLSLNEGAFQCELIRGGLHSVPEHQIVAAESLGMNRSAIFRHILLPQAARAMIPPFGNEAVSLLKNTSLASVIAVPELTQRSQEIASSNFQYIPVFMAAGVMYLAATTAIAIGQSILERRYSPSRGPKHDRPSPMVAGQTLGLLTRQRSLWSRRSGHPGTPLASPPHEGSQVRSAKDAPATLADGVGPIRNSSNKADNAHSSPSRSGEER